MQPKKRARSNRHHDHSGGASATYQKRTRELREISLLHVEPTPWSAWSEHQLELDVFTRLDKRRAARLVRAKLNDDAGRGQTRRIQVRITRLEHAST